MKQQRNAKIMLMSSMAIFGTLGLFVRKIGVSSGEIALYRAILATVIIGFFLLISKKKMLLSNVKKEIPLLLASGIAMGFNWILLFEAYRYTTVSIATLSYYFAPIIVTIACPILFREQMKAKQWICFAMSTVGLVLITGIGDVSAGSNHLMGILLGLGAACLYATVILLNKFIKGVGGIQRTFLQFIAAIVVLVPYVAFASGATVSKLNISGWWALLVVGFVHTGITYCLYFSALKELPGQTTAILSYIDPLVAILLSVFVLKEQMTIVQIIGGIFILGFTLWNEIPAKK